MKLDSSVSAMAASAIAQAAEEIQLSFESYHAQFRLITRRSQSRFETRDWSGVVMDARERLSLYPRSVEQARAKVAPVLGDFVGIPSAWVKVKETYVGQIRDHYASDLARTFFNSVSRRFLFGDVARVKFQDEGASPPATGDSPLYTSYDGTTPLQEIIRRILVSCPFHDLFADMPRDAERVAGQINGYLHEVLASDRFDRLDAIHTPFFRNKAAFIIGRIDISRLVIPLVILLRHHDEGVVVHSVLFEEAKAGRLFSNTRSNFHVDVDRHRELIAFLQSTLPQKHDFEFFAGIGYFNHARTKLYDDIFRHLADSGEKFETAPGARGKVLYVFTLPTFPMVFKVIRDHPDPPKTVTREEVIVRYQFVRTADRAGRMLDSLTFGDLELPQSQFQDEVLQELLSTATETVSLRGDRVVFRHVYVQRQVTPLPLYFREMNNIRLHRDAIVDYGYLIKDLASVNIFLGDYLLKNFGVTSYGRVVSFDYDELDLLTSQNFHEWPSSRDDEEEFLGSHIESMVVQDNDVFPEEFERHLGIPRYLMAVFKAEHADLFTAEYYQQLQERLLADEVIDISSTGVGALQD